MPTGSLPESGKKLWEEVYDKAKKGSCKDAKDPEACAAGSAWKATKNAGWRKDNEGQWHKKSEYIEEYLTIKKAYVDPKTGEKRWRADTSNTFDDKAGDNMTLELFNDFKDRIEVDELAPENYRSAFWEGGMPYLSVSHYPDLDGKAVPGIVDAVYVDGSYLKAKGRMNDSPVGLAAWKAICEDFEKIKKGEAVEDKIRVSIGFLDYAHKHKSNGYLFERKSLEDICPECLKEILEGEYAGRSFLKGLLVHLAMTRVPMNPDTTIDPEMEVTRSMTTRKEDAASIVGSELAEELDKEAKMIGKSEVLITKQEDEEEDDEESKDKKKKKKEDAMEEEACGTDKKHMKSEAEDAVTETPVPAFVSDFTPILHEIEELKALIAKPEPRPEHILDEPFSTLRAAYDEIARSEGSADDKLRMFQQSFNEFGGAIVSTFKSSAVEEPVVEKADNSADIVRAFSEALQPLTQKLDLILAHQTPGTKNVEVPARRSFDPLQIQQSQATNPYAQKKMLTIDELAKRSVGLPV